MKTILIVILATLSSGCAVDQQRANEALQAYNQARQQQFQRNAQQFQQYTQNNPVKNYDFQCVNDCQSAGYTRQLCLSKCSY